MSKTGIFIGRISPMTRGHQRVIKTMIDAHDYDNTLIILGSSNAPISVRHLFSYADRMKLIRYKFPEINIVGIADQNNDEIWLRSLEDILNAVFPKVGLEDCTFYTGTKHDIPWLMENFGDDVNVEVISRYGNEDEISATKVRDSLFRGQTIFDIYGVDENPGYRELLWELFHKQKKVLFSQ